MAELARPVQEVSRVTDPRQRVVMRRQLAAYAATRYSVLAGNLLTAVLIFFVAWPFSAANLLTGWLILALGLIGVRFAAAQRLQHLAQRPITTKMAKRLLRGTILLMSVIGIVWGAVFAWTLQQAPTHAQIILTLAAAGLTSAVPSTSGVIPKAALGFGAPIVLGVAVGLGTYDPKIMLELCVLYALYSAVMIRALLNQYRMFEARTLGEIDLVDRNDTVNMLLHSFEAHSSDWLWQVDRAGNLGGVSGRFAQAAGRPVESLEQAGLVELFDRSPERATLAARIAAGRSFHNLTVPLTVNGEQRWWQLSAQELRDPNDRAIIGLRGFAADITEARRAEARISYLAHFDSLTGLPNRSMFRETLQQRLLRTRNKRGCALLCLDLDEFKAVNDTLGHPVGDELLKIVAQRLADTVRSRDVVARLGGDEFSILLHDLEDEGQLWTLCDRLIDAVAAPVRIAGHEIITSTSIGIALAPDDGQTDEEMIKNADLALYSAKRAGRNCYHRFDRSMDQAARERRELEMALRDALTNDQLRIVYQPLICLQTGMPSGYEALMRWQHAELGVIPPDRFISIAEDTGLIVQLGEWVLRNAAAEALNWPDDVSISVNLSPVQMRSPGLVAAVISVLAQTGLAPQRLMLEITETVLMQDSDANLATLERLRELGVRIALDDFGTGYSSLNYLRAFPFDKIKIDRCFIADIHLREDNQAIVSTIIQLAGKLGMTTTAEGVETIEQVQELMRHGCHEAQGYYYSRAVPPHELTDLRREAPVMPIKLHKRPPPQVEAVDEFDTRQNTG